jgi:hypothetical protein
MISTKLWCNVTSSAQTHLTGVQPRELLCSKSGALRRLGQMVVETWIGKLKHISFLLRLGTSVGAFLGA